MKYQTSIVLKNYETDGELKKFIVSIQRKDETSLIEVWEKNKHQALYYAKKHFGKYYRYNVVSPEHSILRKMGRKN